MAGIGRREVLAGAAALAAAGGGFASPAWAQSASQAAEAEKARADTLRAVFGGRVPVPGMVRLRVPVVAENGNSVQIAVAADPGPDGAMAKRIVLSAPGNPFPLAAEARFGPRAARAEAVMRLRFGRSQTVLAVAELPDGSLRSASADITVTLGACAENFENP